MPNLPYRVTAPSGQVLDFTFPLHEQTASAMRVQQLLTALLETVSREMSVLGATHHGDSVQALSMALATRAALVELAPVMALELAVTLAQTATTAASQALPHHLPAGHA